MKGGMEEEGGREEEGGGRRREIAIECDCNAMQCDSNAMRLQCNAMRLQFNAIAMQRNAIEMQCDCNAPSPIIPPTILLPPSLRSILPPHPPSLPPTSLPPPSLPPPIAVHCNRIALQSHCIALRPDELHCVAFALHVQRIALNCGRVGGGGHGGRRRDEGSEEGRREE